MVQRSANILLGNQNFGENWTTQRHQMVCCDILSFPFPSPFACVTSGPLFPFLSRLLPPFPLFSSLLLVLLPRSRLLPPFLFPSSFLFLPPSFFLPFFLPFFLLSPPFYLPFLPSPSLPCLYFMVAFGLIFGYSVRDFSSFSSFFLDF